MNDTESFSVPSFVPYLHLGYFKMQFKVVMCYLTQILYHCIYSQFVKLLVFCRLKVLIGSGQNLFVWGGGLLIISVSLKLLSPVIVFIIDCWLNHISLPGWVDAILLIIDISSTSSPYFMNFNCNKFTHSQFLMLCRSVKNFPFRAPSKSYVYNRYFLLKIRLAW